MTRKVEYKLTNHVVSAKISERRSLTEIFKILGHGLYRPKKFSALTCKFQNPKATIIFFSTGNITIMGSESYYGALYVLNKVKQQLGIKFVEIKLNNIVAKFLINDVFAKSLDIQTFFLKNSGKCVEVIYCDILKNLLPTFNFAR